MKKNHLLLIIVGTITFAQCSKKHNDGSKADLTKGLLVNFKFDNQLFDSAKEFQVGYLGLLSYGKDRKNKDKSAIVFDSGYVTFKCYGWSVNPFSVSLWVLSKNKGYNNFFIRSEQGIFGLKQHSILSSSMSYGMTVTTNTTITAMAPAKFGWIHVVGTYDGENIKTYINGELKSTMNHPGQTGGTNQMMIGSISNPQWQGSLDDMRFYNRILTDEEILLLSQQ